jgi:hypothetical protein
MVTETSRSILLQQVGIDVEKLKDYQECIKNSLPISQKVYCMLNIKK